MSIPSTNRVGVWLVPLVPHPSAATLAACRSLLDEAERARADRFVHAPAREQFVIARAMLRRLLTAHAPAVAPIEWRFSCGPHGKPSTANLASSLEFNLSHTDGLVALAISRDGPVGVDVERVDRPIDLALFDQVLSPAECAELNGLDGDARRRRFYAIWTAKEAYAKAIGTGLSERLKDLTVVDAETSPIVREQREAWRLHRLAVGAEHAATLASFDPQPPVVRWCAAEDVELR